MSFRDGQRRYGHVPPVQYPVAGQAQDRDDQTGLGLDRRPSFNSGDDRAHYAQLQTSAPTYDGAGYGTAGGDELFLASPSSTTSSTRPPTRGSTSAALSGFQHQYQDPAASTPQQTTYNPQSFAQPTSPIFARTQSTNLPYRQPQPSPQYPTHRTSFAPSPTNYTPQAYNPAAYASATSPQRQPTYHGYNNYNPQEQAYAGAPGPSHTSPTFGHGQAPVFTHPASFPQPEHSYAQRQNSSAGTYNPSQYAAGAYPSHGSNGNSPGQQAYTQAPYPTTSYMPVGPASTSMNDHDTAAYTRGSRANSANSISSPGTTSGLQRHPTNAPLPRRPMDTDPGWDRGHAQNSSYDHDQEQLMHDIEAELGAIGPRGGSRGSRPPSRPANGSHEAQFSDDGSEHLRRYNSSATTLAHSASMASTRRPYANSAFDEDDDDPEGTAGVIAMQQAELDDRRFSGATFTYNGPTPPGMPSSTSTPLPPPPEEQDRSSSGGSEVGGGMVDLGMLSGGYAGNLTYGDVGSPPSDTNSSRPLPSPNYFDNQYDSRKPEPNYSGAIMDYGGTGGLQSPREHRLSFDEGDERVSLHSKQSGDSAGPEEYQDLFYHPGLSNRPLPIVPRRGAGSDSSSTLSVNTNNRGHLQHTYSTSADLRYPPHENPEALYDTTTPGSLQPERSISLVGHSNTPQVYTPARSRTDAAEERRKFNRHQHIAPNTGPPSIDYDAGSVGAFDGITLPTGRKRRFVPSKLSSGDFRRCLEPWALSNVEAWIRDMADGEVDLRRKAVEEGLVLLFTFKVPTMNVADAEVLSSRVVSLMLDAQLLLPEEEWVKFGDGHISGVLWQLTGSGCYAPRLHEHDIPGRCYSTHCTRTVKKIDLDELDPEQSRGQEWHVFYGLTKEDIESRDKKEVQRQNVLHEIVTGEENYIKQLEFFRLEYRDDMRTRRPPLIPPERQEKFFNSIFGKLDSVLTINKDNLLAQLKYRQQSQGPWIVGFSDILREWIRKARTHYVEYAFGYPRAEYMIRNERDRNLTFRKFTDDKVKLKSSGKHDWAHFLIAPITRLQRYVLLLESVDKLMKTESEEKTNLQKAMAEIKAVALECDAKVDETNKRVEMMQLDRMLVLRPSFETSLNLDHLGRQLLMQGELTRLGSKGVRWVDMHALLFDHCLILAKTVYTHTKEKKYDVSKEPIFMPLLFLESVNDEPIQRQKGITTPLGRTTTSAASSNQLTKVATNNSGKPVLEHVSTSSSLGTLTPAGSGDGDGRILYPFRLKHLGHEVYTLYASSARDRMEWCQKLIEAKTNHAKALHEQSAEPFRLRVLADAAFNYESSLLARTPPVAVKGTPLDRAIQDLEGVLGSAQGIAPVCRAQVNCATGFSAFGKPVIAIGTDFGVYISDPSNPRGWVRTVQATRVTQIAVLEEFQVCLLISERSLISFPLDVVAPVSEFAPPSNDSTRRAPQRLAKDVTYFATGRMKDRTLVFYKKKEGLHTTFKVLEPIYHKATEKKRFFGGRKGGLGSTETFRDFDDFFFPTECYSLSLFQTYIAVATSKGVEMLTLDKKQPMSIPDLKGPAIANIANRISNQRPLGMFRLNENEFIVTYEDCAAYVDKHGEISRTLIMEYAGKQKKARGATMYGQYLLLFNEDYVEVRNAENGRLRQIIAGKDVRVLDYGIRGPTGNSAAVASHTQGRNGHLPNVGDASKGTVKIAMCHPELPGRQIVLEMLLNEGHTDS